MTEIFALAGLVAFVGASAIVGLRIVLLAIRTGKLPEWAIGLSLVLAGAIGTGLSILPMLVRTGPSDLFLQTDRMAIVFNHVGYTMLLLFVWRVFRPAKTWAALFFAGLSLALAFGAAGMFFTLVPGLHIAGPEALVNRWSWLSLCARIVGYAWAAAESFGYHAKLKRRLALGLGDAAVAQRFYLWGVCSTAVLAIWLTVAVRWVLTGGTGEWAGIISALLGFVVAGSLWKAFFARPSSKSQSREGEASPIFQQP